MFVDSLWFSFVCVCVTNKIACIYGMQYDVLIYMCKLWNEMITIIKLISIYVIGFNFDEDSLGGLGKNLAWMMDTSKAGRVLGSNEWPWGAPRYQSEICSYCSIRVSKKDPWSHLKPLCFVLFLWYHFFLIVVKVSLYSWGFLIFINLFYCVNLYLLNKLKEGKSINIR